MAELDSTELLERLDIGVVVHDADERILYANPAACALLGATRDEITGLTSLDARWSLTGPDGGPLDRESVPARVARRTGAVVRNVMVGVNRPRTGDRVWLLVGARPMLDGEGHVTHVVVSFSDATETQRAVIEAAEMYQSVIRAMSEGVVVHDADGSIRFANPSAERVLGQSLDQLTGRSPLDPRWRLTMPNGGRVTRGDIPSEITQATGKPCANVVLGVHRPSGERAWLSINTDPFGAVAGSGPRGVVATFTDITRDRDTQLALAESRSQLQRVLDAVPGVVYQFLRDESGRDTFPFATASLQELFGVSPEDAAADAKNVYSRIHPDDLPRMMDALNEAARTFEPFDVEHRAQGDDGKYRWMRSRSVPSDKRLGALWTGVTLDITEQRALQDGLRRTQRREAMGDLAAGLAHNFNNMLAAIQPNIELALLEAPASIQPLLADAKSAASSAAELVRQLLTLGRSEHETSAAGAFDARAVVDDVLRIARSTFPRVITLEAKLEDGPLRVRGNPSHLHQLLLNLLLNARDAVGGREAPRLSVELTHGERQLLLRVADNGVGMDDATRARLGEPFFSTKAPGLGTGLGLASAFGNARELRATLTAETEHGVGTTFTLTAPLAPQGATVEARAARRDSRLAGKVLVIEDEPLVRRAIVRQLAATGLEVIEHESGDAALEWLARADQDVHQTLRVAVLDLSLPGTQGDVILRALNQLLPKLPVLIVSGHIAEDVDLALAAAVLRKPLEGDVLVRTISRVLGVDRLAADAD
jgi:hypothetical protein